MRVRRISVRIELAEAGVVKQLISAVFYCPVWSEVFFVIARAKARSNPVLADFKRSDVCIFKLLQKGLFLHFFALKKLLCFTLSNHILKYNPLQSI